MRRLRCYIDPTMYGEIEEIARSENLEFPETVRQLLSISLRYYRHKRGTLNPNAPQNSKTFYCQSCRRETRLRNVIYKQIDFDQYLICEDCAFDQLRLDGFVSRILRGMRNH